MRIFSTLVQLRFSDILPASISFLRWFHQNELASKKDLWWRLVFSIRTLVHFNSCKDWIEYVRVRIYPKARPICADMFQQPMKPFYCCTFAASRIARMLVNTHEVAQRVFGSRAYEHLLSGGKITLSHIAGVEGKYRVTLQLSRLPRRESVFSLKFESEAIALTELGFHFDLEDHQMVCLIGNVQPVLIGVNLENIRIASKDLHHLHPRVFLIQVLRQLCAHSGVGKLEGVASRRHIWNSWRYRLKNNAGELKYDEIWRQFGGEPKSDGNFDLPLVQHERDLSSYPQKKRHLIRKKQKLIASVSVILPESFAEPA